MAQSRTGRGGPLLRRHYEACAQTFCKAQSLLKPIRSARSARRHKIGKRHAYHVVVHATSCEIDVDAETGFATMACVGRDERGRELEVVIVEKPDCFLLIHAMPTALRRKEQE